MKLKKINIHITLISLLFFIAFFGIPGGSIEFIFLPEHFERSLLEFIELFFILSGIFIILKIKI